MAHGEAENLVIEAWADPQPTIPPDMVIVSIFGAAPRVEFCTAESVREAVPTVKRFIQEQGDPEVLEAWRHVCGLAGLDFDAVEAVRPVPGTVQ